MKPITRTALVIALTLAAGCAGGNAIEATTVLNYDQCQRLSAGLTQVDYAAVAGIRGGRLLGMTRPDEKEAADAGPGPDADADADADADEDLLLIAVSRGQQPTPGYGFVLDGVHRRGNTAVITVQWQTPDPDAVLAQMTTHPCLVVGLPRRGFDRVEAVDQAGGSVGTLAL